MQTFATPSKTRIVVYNPAGTVDVRAVQGTQTTVELLPRSSETNVEDVSVTCVEAGDASVVTITFPNAISFLRRRGAIDVQITAPERSDVSVSTTGAERSLLMLTRGESGDVRLHGLLGNVDVGMPSADVVAQVVDGSLTIKTASGDTNVDTVRGPVKVQAVSGDVRLGTVEADATITLVSGDVELGQALHEVDVTSVSGDVTVNDARQGASAKSTSGDVTVRRAWNGTVRAGTVSGDIVVGVPSGRGVGVEARSMSGELRSEIDLDAEPGEPTGGDVVRIVANSVSGDVQILRSAAANA